MKKDIFQKIEEAHKPDFGDILTRSFEFFKKVWQEGLMHVLVTIAMSIPIIILIYVPYILFFVANGVFNEYGINNDGYYNDNFYEPDLLPLLPWIILYALGVLLLIFVLQALTISVTAHFYKVCKKIDTGTPVEVGGYFDYIKEGGFKKLFLLSLATFGIALAATLLCYLPIFYVMVPLQLIVVIYAFNKELSVSEIIKASFKLGHKFWLIIFGLIIISSLIAQLGIVLCFVGLLVTAYFVHLPIYFVYKDTIGFDDDLTPTENEFLSSKA